MKITIFIIVLVLKSNENIKIWHFRLPQLANSSKACENSLFEDVLKEFAPSSHKSSKFSDLVWPCWWSSVADCLQDFLQLVDGIGLGYT